jgi:ankyrin repeat protein
VLLGHGAEVNERMQDGDTPLHQAAWQGHVEAAELLIAAGAAVGATKEDGASCLHLAASKGTSHCSMTSICMV